MRWVALAVILASLPAFIALLRQYPKRRDIALLALGVLVFADGALQVDAAIITWPMWTGTVRGITISPIDTLALALILTRRGQLNRVPFLWLIAIFALPMIFSLVESAVPMATMFSIAQLFRITLFYVAVAGELGRPNAMRNLLAGLSISLIIQAGFVIYQKLNGVVQAIGTMSHQNTLGLMVELTALPLIAAIFEGERNKIVYAGILSGFIITAGGGSRGTMAFLSISILLFLIFTLARRSTPHKFKLIGLGVAAAVVVVPMALATLETRFGGDNFSTEETQRAAFERAARAMASDHPLGVGANMFISTNNVQGYATRAGLAWNPANRAAPVHNAYLLARAEMGWAGELALILLFVVSGLTAVRVGFADRKIPMVGIAIGSGAAILAMSIHNNYEFAWFSEFPQRLFFLNLAIIAGCMRIRQNVGAERRRAALSQLANTQTINTLPPRMPSSATARH